MITAIICIMIFIILFISPMVTAVAVGIFIYEHTGFIPFVVVGGILDFVVVLIIGLVASYHLILSLE